MWCVYIPQRKYGNLLIALQGVHSLIHALHIPKEFAYHHTYSPLPLVLRTLTITRTASSMLQLRRFWSSNGTSGATIAEISISNPSEPSTSANNILAYRPNYADFHRSGLAAVFLNIEQIFPCASRQAPICRIFTYKEDGFRDGKAIIEAGESGNNFYIFSSTEDIRTYGFAFQGCEKLNGTNGCMPIHFNTAITCQLPRNTCWVPRLEAWLADEPGELYTISYCQVSCSMQCV